MPYSPLAQIFLQIYTFLLMIPVHDNPYFFTWGSICSLQTILNTHLFLIPLLILVTLWNHMFDYPLGIYYSMTCVHFSLSSISMGFMKL